MAHRGYARYLRETEKGGLEIDWGRVRDDERFDGKYVLLSNGNPCGNELPTSGRVLGRGAEEGNGGAEAEAGGGAKEAGGHRPEAASGYRVKEVEGVTLHHRILVRNSVKHFIMR